MKRYILTGAPGCGKTVLIRELELRGYSVVEEAATDIIALQQAQGSDEPWTDPSFIDQIISLQRSRQLSANREGDGIQFFDRSPFCTVALSRYLEHAQSSALEAEIARIFAARIYEKKVFFLESLGFIQNTAARRISFEEAKRFEQLHLDVYRDNGFELVRIPAGTISERADRIVSVAT